MDYSKFLTGLPTSVCQFVEEKAKICKPDRIMVCDGSDEEFNKLADLLQKDGVFIELKKLKNWYKLLLLFKINNFSIYYHIF
jgi:GTP-dependent phosphoenolpyruvate carboxykinase